MYYQIGAIIGLLLTGLAADVFLRKQRWLLLLLMNVLLLAWDLFLFWKPVKSDDSIVFSLLVSMFMTGNDLVYLILIPMLVARRLQLNVARVSPFKVTFSGTITGIVLSFCLAGKFLISQNLATILYYATQKSHVWAQDLLIVALLLLSNIVVWGQIRPELEKTRVYKYVAAKCCCCCGSTETLNESDTEHMRSKSSDIR